MYKKLLAVAALAACSLAQAYDKQYDITYTGFYDEVRQTYDSDLTLNVRFVVDDLNNDGRYSYNEVKSFQSYGIRYYGSCQQDFFVDECLYNFSYTPGEALTFHAYRSVHDDIASSTTEIISGQSLYHYSAMGYEYERWSWTADTTMSVVSNVPEPGAYLMLTAGLGGMLAIARRRRAAR